MASIIKRNNNFCVVYSYKDAYGTPSRSGKPLLTFRMPRIARKRSNIRNRLELL